MYLKKIYLENIACFEDISIDLSNSNNSGLFSVFLGDNGAGKTTLLRCIALGLCNESGAAALVRELQGDLVRIQGDKYVSIIELELYESNPEKTITIRTEITETAPGDIELTQTTRPKKNFPWENIFLCGYGSFRGKYEHQDMIHYYTVDSVYTLFNYEAKLQNPELILRRLESSKERDKIFRTIEDILMLPKESIILTNKGIGFDGLSVDKVSVGGWGDGHRATLTWLSDLFSWSILYNENWIAKDISGIVLVDELEHHLHPSWQRRIVKQLNKHFPKLQFIVSSHSPFCAIGTTDLPKDIANIFLLKMKNDSSKLTKDENSIRGWGSDQLLTSYLFGLENMRSNDTGAMIDRYLTLTTMIDLSDEEVNEKGKLKIHLDNLFGSSGSELQQEIEKEVRKAIDKYILDNLEQSDLSTDVITYNIRHHLKKIFRQSETDD